MKYFHRSMNEIDHILELERRIEFLEAAVKEINPGLVFPRDPAPHEKNPTLIGSPLAEVDRKRKVKYLVFAENGGKAYNWAVQNCIGSLEWILIQGDEQALIDRWHKQKTFHFKIVEIGAWRSAAYLAGSKIESLYHLILEDYARPEDRIILI